MKILFADDHDLVRETLVMFLTDQGLGSVRQVGDVEGALKALRDTPGGFDLILLDYDMPGMDGLAGLARVQRQAGKCPVAILSGTASSDIARSAIEAGARGFVPKTIGARSLASAIALIAAGEVFVPYGFMDKPAEQPVGDLTLRETQVLRGLSEGKSNKDIARDLGLHEVTIKLHVKTLCRKLDARNRTQAAMIARDRRLIG